MVIPDGMPGGALSLSANGNRDGIIWASVPKFDSQWTIAPGRLMAFDATTLQELWRDDDNIAFAKFAPPTVADGKVFRPTFANKLIVYGVRTGLINEPCYSITAKYDAYGKVYGWLGSPTSSIQGTADGRGRFKLFHKSSLNGLSGNAFPFDGDHEPILDYSGAIFAVTNGCAHELHGSIYSKWSELGSERGPLGYPVSDEALASDGLGRLNAFEHGFIYCLPAPRRSGAVRPDCLPGYGGIGPHAVYGAIGEKWNSLGREQFGYPTTDETVARDGCGRYNDFSDNFNDPGNKSIYWTPETGAHEVHGAIRAHWLGGGAELSPFGYPVSDEVATFDGRGTMQLFEHGLITWYPDRGVSSNITSPNNTLHCGQRGELPEKTGDPASRAN
jgi:uncharacterized protein with LGFP repeats